MVRLGAVLGVAAALGIPADVLDGERDILSILETEQAQTTARLAGSAQVDPRERVPVENAYPWNTNSSSDP